MFILFLFLNWRKETYQLRIVLIVQRMTEMSISVGIFHNYNRYAVNKDTAMIRRPELLKRSLLLLRVIGI